MIDYENGFEECSETKAMFLEDAAAELADRMAFVRNVGRLAAQTRWGVKAIEYIPAEIAGFEAAKIIYKKGEPKLVNIDDDSYTAIVRDIFKFL